MPRKKKEDTTPSDLHPLYLEYYEEQTHLKPSTLQTLVDRLRSFPKNPDDLNPDYFRQRMKEVSPHTLKAEVALGKRFLEWADRDTSGFKKLKLPRREETVTVEDLYTDKEITQILANTANDRDHALISVLYESACRVGELCSMTFDRVMFTHHKDEETGKETTLAVITISGKTGTRDLELMVSVPSLRHWMNMHPTGEGKLWVDLRKGHRPITRHTVDSIVRACLRKSELDKKKRKVVHMFRHTRLTELVRKGVRGQPLARIAGWTKRSNMEAVYVHLSSEDVRNEVRSKVFGLGNGEQPIRPILDSPVCRSCGYTNRTGIKYCEGIITDRTTGQQRVCNFPLTDEILIERATQKTDLEEQVANLQQTVLRMGQAVVQITEHLAFMPEDELRENMAVTRDITNLLTLVRVQDKLANTPKDELQEQIDRFNMEQEKEGKMKVNLAYWEELLAGAPKIELQQILQNPKAIVDMIRMVREKEKKEKEQEKTSKKQSKKKKS